MLKLVNVCKKYENNKVIDNFNVTINKGEKVAFIGESGKGKTTLFKVLIGIENIDEGFIENNKNDISVSFQEDIFANNFSIKDNIDLILDKETDFNSIQKDLNDMGINKKPSDKISTLSIGMKRRVSTIRAFKSDRKIIMLDEPFAGLDIESINLTKKYIKENIKDRTLIIFTHSKEIVEDLVDKIYKLEDGR